MEKTILSWLIFKINHTNHMKTFIVTTEIKVTIEAESLEAAEEKYFDANIGILDGDGQEMDWTIIDSQIDEV